MRKLFCLFLTCHFLTSCVTQDRCLQKFPPATKDSTYTKIDSVIVHDTTYVPYRFAEWDTTLNFIKDVVLHRVVNNNGVTGTLDINKGKVSFKCESDSLKLVIEKLREREVIFNQKKSVQYLPCDKEHRTKRDSFTLYFTGISLILILIAFIAWVVKKFVRSG